MAQAARRRAAAPESPPSDPAAAVDRAYHVHRARRQARVARSRSVKRAGMRFWVFLLVLVALAVFLLVTVWHEVQRLFGL